MRASSFIKFAAFGVSTILFRRKKPILGTVILTDRCNLSCKHCAVNNLTSVMHPYGQIMEEMRKLYGMGVRILFFCGGETFLWESDGKRVRDLVIEAKRMGFLIVNVVTNGTFPLELPEADLILLSLDGGKQNHNLIRGDTYDLILQNIRAATSDNICLYTALNQINKGDIAEVCETAKVEKNIRAISFNFHTPYPGTEQLLLTNEQKTACCDEIKSLIKQKYPIFNLKSAFPYLVRNTFKTPCRQCVVIENGKVSVCGRCIDVDGLCGQCGYFFAAEYSLIFRGKVRVIFDMLRTYPKYV